MLIFTAGLRFAKPYPPPLLLLKQGDIDSLGNKSGGGVLENSINIFSHEPYW